MKNIFKIILNFIRESMSFENFIKIVEVSLIFWTMVGAWYFGFNQKKISEKLGAIEEYNLQLTKKEEFSNQINSRKELRQICSEIITFLEGNTNKERNDVTNRSLEVNVKIAQSISNLLTDGLSNTILKNDKESLSHWLRAMNVIQCPASMSRNKVYYYLHPKNSECNIVLPKVAPNSLGETISLCKIDNANNFLAWIPENKIAEFIGINKNFDIQIANESIVRDYANGSIQETVREIMAVYSKLDLSFTKLRKDIENDLKVNQ